MPAYSDPFRLARESEGVLKCPFHGEPITMLLRHDEVRQAAKDWQTFSSDAPFRVPIPSEETVRSMRQLPIETDPPQHGIYREVVEPFFQRAKQPEVIARVEALIERVFMEAMARDRVEVVRELALPIQSLALTHLLNVSEEEAALWISWGIHVFKSDDGQLKEENVLETYLHRKFDEASPSTGEDFFSVLARTQVSGRGLSREEMMGFANLAFAGGRDTIIHSITCVLGYLAESPRTLEYLREDPKRIILASEEFFRVFMPLTHIGRVCPNGAEVHGQKISPGERVSLCWSSANFDQTVFPRPMEIELDRKPNPHLSFGFGTHLCLGAPHARLIMHSLLKVCSEKLAEVQLLQKQERSEREERFERILGYDRLLLRFVPRGR